MQLRTLDPTIRNKYASSHDVRAEWTIANHPDRAPPRRHRARLCGETVKLI
jgi:hypothetical protein